LYRVVIKLFRILVAVLAINVVAALLTGGYDIHLAGLTLTAHNIYKPLLLLNAAFLCFALLPQRRSQVPGSQARLFSDRLFQGSWLLYSACLSIAIVAAYFPSLSVNFAHYDWTHRHISAALGTQGFTSLFTVPQADGMYRPLTFLSYWVDYRLFGNHLWAYHLQSIAFHILNALLVAALAVELGFSGDVPRLSAALFGLAAVHFEPVLWPAARFDLISCAFTLMSFLFFLKYCRQDRRSTVWLPLTVLTFVAGVLNKETSYSVLLLVPALLLSFRFWNLGKLSAKNAALALGLLFASGACLVGVRFAVLGGIGSYGFRDPSAPHIAVTWKSIYSLLVNVLALPVFSVNATIQNVLSGSATVIFAGTLVAAAYFYSGAPDRKPLLLFGFAVLSAVPAIGVIGWINPSLQHTRHVYLPSAWTAMAFAVIISNCAATEGRGSNFSKLEARPRPPWGRMDRVRSIAVLFLLSQVLGLVFNEWVYADMFRRSDVLARQIATEVGASSAPDIALVGLPGEPNGVFYFGSQVQLRLRDFVPNALVRVCSAESSPECSPVSERQRFAYRWGPAERTLDRIIARP
jgi:hypothetical protein